MTSRNKYTPIRHISILMALDAGAAILDAFVYWVGPSLWAAIMGTDTSPASDAVKNFSIYMAWTIMLLRLLLWALTLLALFRLTDIFQTFQKAKLWYLLRVLAYIALVLLAAYGNYQLAFAANWENAKYPLVVLLLLIAACTLLGETLLLPMGNRAVLDAGAELLDTFGLESQAQKNRRCGKRLLVFSLLFQFLLLFAVGLAAGVWLAAEVWLYSTETDAFPVLTFLDIAALLLAFPAGFCVLAYRFLAAVHAGRTYRAIEVLTR